MKNKEILFEAATYLQLDAVAAHFDTGGTLTESDEKEAALLLRCLNAVIGELSVGTFPLLKAVHVSPKAGKIPFADLPSDFAAVVTVKEKGRTVPYELYAEYIAANADECDVTYAAKPPAATLEGECPFFGSPSARTLAYGVAREYCLISGRTDDAAMWDARFVNSVTEESRKKGEMRVKARAWI